MSPIGNPTLGGAAKTGLGISSRRLLRPVLERLEVVLEDGERVREIAPGWGRTAGFGAYVPGTIVFAGALAALWALEGEFATWTALVVALAASFAVDWAVRRRRGLHALPRRVVAATDRRLLELDAGAEHTEIPLDRVRSAEVAARRLGRAATVRVVTDEGPRDVEIMSEWPKRGAPAAARAIVEALGARADAS